MIDKRQNARRLRDVQEARRKDRVSDILADVNLDKRTAVGAVDYQTSAQHLVKVKCEIREKKLMTSQLNLIMNFKAISGVVYLKAILKKI